MCVNALLKVKETGIVIFSPSYLLKTSQSGECRIWKKIIYLENYTTLGKGIRTPEWVSRLCKSYKKLSSQAGAKVCANIFKENDFH